MKSEICFYPSSFRLHPSDFRSIDLGSIRISDRNFFLHHRIHSEPLSLSVKQIGIINPPLVQRISHKRFRIICGFRRVHAARVNRMDKLDCRVLPPEAGKPDLLLLSLYDNLTTHTLHPVEKSIVINKLESFFDQKEIIRKYFPLLGLPPHEKAYKQISCLARLENRIQDALFRGDLAQTVALPLYQLNHRDRTAVFNLLNKIRLSVSKQKEVTEYLINISRREAGSIFHLIGSSLITDIMENNNLPGPQKGELLRSNLRQRRFPEITQTEEKFFRIRRSLRLSNAAQLLPPTSFESDTFQIRFGINSVEDLQYKIRFLMETQDKPGWKELFELC